MKIESSEFEQSEFVGFANKALALHNPITLLNFKSNIFNFTRLLRTYLT